LPPYKDVYVKERRGVNMAAIAEKLINQIKWDVVLNMLRLGLSIDIISESTGFTADQIKEFKEKMQEQKENAAA
jgi:hypothetical protein